MNKTVVAVFDARQDAQSALDALTQAGFASSQARVTSSESISAHRNVATHHEREQSLGERIADFFGFGDDDETYTEAVRRGGHVVTVDAADDQEAERAESVMMPFAPIDIDQRVSEWRQSGWQPAGANLSEGPTRERTVAELDARHGASHGRSHDPTHLDRHIEAVIPVAEERLAVGKRGVQRGGIRVISRTVEQPVDAKVSLREEHAIINRRPVDRPVTDADTAFKATTIEVRETAEEAVVGKTARVVEEVQVRKEATVREETVQDAVRKTEVDVERIGARDDSPDHVS